MNNNHGNITSMGILVTLSLLSLLLLNSFTLEKTRRKVLLRTKTYLCFKYLKVKNGSFLKRMAQTNNVISWADKIALAPPLTSLSKKIKASTILLQNLFLFSLVKKMLKNTFCSFRQGFFIISNHPYKPSFGALLNRYPDGTAILRKTKWTIMIRSKSLPFPSNFNFPIVLKGSFIINSRFNTKIKFSSKEVAQKDFLKWRRFSGG